MCGWPRLTQQQLPPSRSKLDEWAGVKPMADAIPELGSNELKLGRTVSELAELVKEMGNY